MSKLKVLMASSEVVPFAKTGGLADVVGALSQELEKLNVELKIFLPKYKQVNTDVFAMQKTTHALEILIGSSTEGGTIWTSKTGKNIEVFLIENDAFYFRDGLYGNSKGDYSDNLERFVFFCKAVLNSIKILNWKPDIIHCHDWQTALIPIYLKSILNNDNFYENIKTVFTIHNLAYQGIFEWEQFTVTGIGWDLFIPEKLEYYNKLNVLKGGLVFSDKLTAVSPTYTKEIQTPESGCGLDDVLRSRLNDLVGILNGVDYSIWSPENDTVLTEQFSASQLENKKKLKRHLLKNVNMPERLITEVPLLGSVSRLADQKGYDLIAETLPELMKLNVRFIILGTGEEKYQKLLTNLSKQYPEKLSVNLLYDDTLAHLIYAGTDMFIMPSKYEPCGLGQLISLKYGSIPVVNPTGGLVDTIRDYNPETNEGNGFVMRDYTSESLLEAIKRGIELYKDNQKWESLMVTGMNQDFSWNNSAKKYLELYNSLLS